MFEPSVNRMGVFWRSINNTNIPETFQQPFFSETSLPPYPTGSEGKTLSFAFLHCLEFTEKTISESSFFEKM